MPWTVVLVLLLGLPSLHGNLQAGCCHEGPFSVSGQPPTNATQELIVQENEASTCKKWAQHCPHLKVLRELDVCLQVLPVLTLQAYYIQLLEKENSLLRDLRDKNKARPLQNQTAHCYEFLSGSFTKTSTREVHKTWQSWLLVLLVLATMYCVSYTPGTEYNIYKGRKKLTQLEANYAKCFDTIAKLESQNASLSSTKSLYDNLLERHNFIRRLLSSLKQERDNTGNDNQAKSREIRLLKYKTDTLTRANNGLLRNIDAKEKEIDELKAKINNLQMNIENKDKVVISLTTKETSLSQAVEEKQRQLGRKEETIKTLQEENTKIRTELDSSLEKLNELEDRASLVERDHYSEISRLNSKLKTVEGERNCYEKGLGDMNFLLEGTTHDQQVLIMERDEAITKLQKLTDEFREENKRTQTLRSQLEDVTRKSKYTEELRNVERTQYQRVRETIIREKTQISEQLQREREDFTRKKSELSQQLTALQKDNEKLVSQTSQPSQKELPDESQLTNLRQRDREDFNRQINELWALHRKRCEELEYQMACNSKQHKAERDKLQLEKQQLSQLLQYEREQFNREKEKFSSKILSISNERDSLCIQPPPGLDVQKAKDLAPGAGLVMQIDGTETEEQKEEVPEPPHLKDWREHAEALRNRLVQGTPQGCQQPTQQPRQPALPNSSPDFQKQTRK